jgi:hypothetical protein
LRNEFPDAPCQIARGFHQAFLRRGPMGLGRPGLAISRLRVRAAKRTLVPPCRWMKSRAFGPAFVPPATWPSWA